MQFFKCVIVLIFLSLSCLSHASNYVQNAVAEQISSINVYGQRTSAHGDLLISLNNPPAECQNGYFIEAGSAGFTNILSVALSAYHAKKAVFINGYKGASWRGWTGAENLCEFEAIKLKN